MAPGKTYGEPVTETEDRVDGSGGLDPAGGQLAPLRKLLGEQPAHERLVDLELVDVHRCLKGRAAMRGS